MSIIQAQSSPLKKSDRVCSQSKKLYEDILASLDREKCWLENGVNFLGKEKKTRRNLYLLLLKTSLWKRSRPFFRTVYPNRSHMTTYPYTFDRGYSYMRQRLPEVCRGQEAFDSMNCL